MHAIDWLLIIVPFGAVLAIALYARRFMKSVADFMSGRRVAGPYLVAVARGEMEAGAAVFIASFEMISRSGFALNWWGWITVPVVMIVSISGFVVYRFRQTRALTLAQFFELRYSKNFRLFTGFLGFFAGITNFGIMPAIGARFLVYFLGMPPDVAILGYTLPTYIPVMAGMLSLILFVTLSGGFITVMVTNCLEGVISQVFYLAIIVALLFMFSWTEINEVLINRPPGQSMVNPFDSLGVSDFNLWYVLMSLFVTTYGTMAWQHTSAYNSAAITPHAAVMGGLLGRWREFGKAAVVTLLAVCAMTYMQHPDFAAEAATVHAAVEQIADPQVQKQMEVPVALSHMLPIGIKGIFCAILLMGIFGGDSTHLHAWGGIFVQDVLVPLRKKPFPPEKHILILRLAIVAVAVFAFAFGCLFRQTEYIFMWWQVTTAIYVGGAGAAIIGGLYWKKGTTAGAWAAILVGSTLSIGGIFARQIFGDAFPFNGVEISFGATLIAIALYVTVSLLTFKGNYDMDRLLHTGAYARKDDPPEPTGPPARKPKWGKLIGIDEGFSVSDKWIAGGLFWWAMFWCGVFLVGTAWNLVAPWPVSVWSTYWHVVGIGIPIFLSIATAIWFSWGGVRDVRRLFHSLTTNAVNHLDDGTVVGHQNLDDAAKGARPGTPVEKIVAEKDAS